MISLGIGLNGTRGRRGWSPDRIFSGSQMGVLFDAEVEGSVTQSSGRVSQWDDISGFGKHATQAVADARPVLRSLGGHPFISSDGLNRQLRSPNLNFSHTNKLTFWAVAYRGIEPGLIGEFGTTYNTGGSFYLATSGVDFAANMGGPLYKSRNGVTGKTLAADIVVVQVDRSTSAPRAWVNGVEVAGTVVDGGAVSGNFNSNMAISLLSRWSGTAIATDSASKLNVFGVVDRLLSESEVAKLTEWYLPRLDVTSCAYAIGDSTIAPYLGRTGVLDLTQTERAQISVAVPGHTIAQQRTRWNALPVDQAKVGWVAIQVGLNDLNWTEAASAAIARLQSLVADVRAKVGSAPIFISQMLQCKQRMIGLYGETNGLTAFAKLQAINEAIAGDGGNPITGVDGRVTAHTALLDDGNGNLAAAYDTGDHIHENHAGAVIVADAWAAAISGAGITV